MKRMMKKKLALGGETLRALDTGALARAQGGYTGLICYTAHYCSTPSNTCSFQDPDCHSTAIP